MSRSIRLLASLTVAALVAACQPMLQLRGSAIEEAGDAERWIVIIEDPRSGRRKGRADAVGYTGRVAYDADPALVRASDAYRA